MEDIIPMTDAQIATRDRARAELQKTYPDHFVGYYDVWDGDVLTRKVVAAAPDLAGFHALLSTFSEEAMKDLRVTEVHAPDGPIFV